MTQGPIVIDLGDEADATMQDVASAPPVPDPDGTLPQGRAMQGVARLAARRPSRLARWFWGLAAALLGTVLSIMAWNFATRLLDTMPVLGWLVAGLLGALVVVSLAIALREVAAISRLARLDGLRHDAMTALAETDTAQARQVCNRLLALYGDRDDLKWGRARLAERLPEQVDASAVLDLAEAEILAPLDAAARLEVEAAARQVATVTALVPMALADVAAALAANLRMIRRVAEIYGGRSGVIGNWRLTRAVFAHLVATGAVAVGDDLLEPILGGSILAKLSRRFGEGLVNGALSARVGVAAMEVCRPLPFGEGNRPSVRSIIRRALSGLVSRDRG